MATVHGGRHSNELAQPGARHARAHRAAGLPASIDAVHGKHVLGEVDADVDNGHDFPLK